MAQLNKDEVVTLLVLHEKGESHAAIARRLGVTEGAVRYHVRRAAAGGEDGRGKMRKADEFAEAIRWWVQANAPPASAGQPPAINVVALHEWLQDEYQYPHSYRSVLRFVRSTYPQARLKPYRRIETPPGAQAQVDWGEFLADVGDGPEPWYAFVLTLSHSRKTVVVWSRRMHQLAWHHCHNEALRRVGGVPAVVRIDNLKTGVSRGAGPWGEVNEAYGRYARSVGFHVDACLPRSPEHKGKVERRVEVLRSLALTTRRYASLTELQAATDEALERQSQRRPCPATGLTIDASWREEQRCLRPLPTLPEVFDVVVTRTVARDCTIRFEDRTYSVPFRFCRRSVEVRGCAEVVQVLHDGQVIAEHRRHTRERIVLDPRHYEGPSTDEVQAPTPLGRLGRRLQELAFAPVEQRPLDLYAALTEVTR